MKLSDSFTDIEIIEKILKGEKSLFEMLVRRYNPYLYKIGRSYNFSHDDTQDIMQDSFVDAYKNLKSYEGRASFKTWISRIMLNNCYKKKDKASYKNEVMLDSKEHTQPLLQDHVEHPESIVHSHELRHIIEHALVQLPEEYRMVFAMREINGMNVAETAVLLNLTEANVKVRLSRAKGMLQNIITKSVTPAELYEFHAVYCDAMVNRVMAEISKL